VKTVSRAWSFVYSCLLALALGVATPWWLFQAIRHGKYWQGLAERFGSLPERVTGLPGKRTKTVKVVWLHAVSVGEVLAASRLITELGQSGFEVYISTTTRTGQDLARERFGQEWVFYFPLDFAFSMRAWLGFLKPSLVVLVESEFWPRMLIECRRAGVPVAVVNARVSDRSWPRYQLLKGLWRPLLGSLALVLAQSERDAGRLRALGAPRVTVAGNLKYDIRVPARAPITDALRARLPEGVPVVVCGSTLDGEEALLLDALPSGDIVIILAPRHPERFEEVAALLAARQLPLVRRSRYERLGELPRLAPGTIVLLDSIGELASVYSLATVAVLGGGFLWPGGHNPLEPAQFGVPVLMGEQYANFREIVARLTDAQAVAVVRNPDLASAIQCLLHDVSTTQAMGKLGQRVCEEQAGATARTVQGLLAIVEHPPLVE
jgi:3-deoxy-D-manno-octulosonic-acid transferase